MGAWIAAVLGGPLALTLITVVFLVVPTGRYLSPRWRWVTRAAVAGYAAYLAGAGAHRAARVQPTRRTPARRCSQRVPPHRRLPRDHGLGPRQRGLHAAAAAPFPRRGAPAAAVGGGRRGIDRAGLAGPDRRAGAQRREAVVVVEHAAVPGLRVPARLHRRGRAPLPPLRRRGDPRPSRGPRHRDSHRRGRLHRSGGGARPVSPGPDGRRVLAVPAAHRRGGAGVPAPAAQSRALRRPVGLRKPSGAVRRAGGLQPADRAESRSGHPAADDRGGCG